MPLPPLSQTLSARSSNALAGLLGGLSVPSLSKRSVVGQLLVSLLPAISIAALLAVMYTASTAPVAEVDTTGLVQAGGAIGAGDETPSEEAGGLQEPPTEDGGLKEPPSGDAKEAAVAPPTAAVEAKPAPTAETTTAPAEPAAARVPAPTWYWIVFGLGMVGLVLISWLMNWQRLEIFKMLLASFFPLAVMILAVLGSIVFGLATPTEAAAVGRLRRPAAGRRLSVRRGEAGQQPAMR